MVSSASLKTRYEPIVTIFENLYKVNYFAKYVRKMTEEASEMPAKACTTYTDSERLLTKVRPIQHERVQKQFTLIP